MGNQVQVATPTYPMGEEFLTNMYPWGSKYFHTLTLIKKYPMG
jgi:hypothetical protein